MLLVSMYSIEIIDSATLSLTTKNLMSICLECEVHLVFLEKDIAVELSQYNFNSLEMVSTTPNAIVKFHNHTA